MPVRTGIRVVIDPLVVYRQDLYEFLLGKQLGSTIYSGKRDRREVALEFLVYLLGRRVIHSTFQFLENGDPLCRYLCPRFLQPRDAFVQSPHAGFPQCKNVII